MDEEKFFNVELHFKPYRTVVLATDEASAQQAAIDRTANMLMERFVDRSLTKIKERKSEQ